MRIGRNITLATTPDRVADEVAAAIRDGLDSVWTNQMPGLWDPLVLLAAAGRVGPTVELGTAIVPTYPRHPVVAATEALTVAAATGAPLTLGLGPSHAWSITDQLGLPYASPAAHSREYLEIVGGLVRGEHVQHRGRFFTVDTELSVPAAPVSLLLSALGPRMLEVARDLTDGTVAVWVRPELVGEVLRPALRDDQRVVVQVLAAVTTDPDGLRERIARDYAAVESMPAYRAVLDRAGLQGPADTLVVGTEEELAREFARFADAGTTDLLVAPLEEPQRVLDVARAVAA
ncbi:TIGR03564 family F420-dependent LLM class oxidoreductase [Actinomycetospora corticicola]|uniref:F420-dependent oxidoreductase-like protein n=1 Tax=Actinomycetospora corticicola TaxID=663602 RepID=A0A7Y9DYI1_9PSEU|nr:TIGR03564 family F420-dependent LLM class oxidoreductase [Actinomycetospora corticicola]NYD37894.1 F420-dependent oxidoreductase-like protein [Actinomycetospora corticicola]